jgi:DeoR family glycerol-3-phosphate regulon repressor
MVRLGSIEEIDALFTDKEPPTSLVEIMNVADVNLFVG